MPRVLVTGCAGFIGSHVAEHCLKLGYNVVGVDDLSGGFSRNIPDGVEFTNADLTQPEAVADLWTQGDFDYVYHLAAYAAEGLSHFIRRFNYNTNLVASVNLINESIAHQVKCFVFTSSIAVYGSSQTPMTEETTPLPEDPYGISKYAVELDLGAANRLFGLSYVIFRPHNVYGERQNTADKYRNVLGIFINQILSGSPITIFGDGSQTRAFTHIDDVAPAIARAPLIQGAYRQVFNIGADEPCSVLDLARLISRAFGRDHEVRYLEAREEVQHAFASHEKFRRIFGAKPTTSLADGIARMVQWARQQPVETPVNFTNIEVPLKLPASWASTSKASDKAISVAT